MDSIDALLKIGGSITKLPEKFNQLSGEIKRICGKGYDLILLMGGGESADAVRRLYERYEISEDAAHWMSLQAMNINSHLLVDMSSAFERCRNPKECHEILKKDKMPVFFPFDYMREKDPVPRSWKVTSDSISLYLSEIFDTKFHILLKDVEGIFKNPAKRNEIFDELSASELKSLEESCLDKYFPELISKHQRKSHIISGLHPERIEKVLKKEKTTETVIKP